MKIRDQKFLFLDCQTTGMRPDRGQILEIAWAHGTPGLEAEILTKLVALEEGHTLPARVQELTGILPEHLSGAEPLERIFDLFHSSLDGSPAVIHYAQFEKPFLSDLFQRFHSRAEPPFEIFCSHQLAKKLLPDLPSQNLRALSGYFGTPCGGLKRATSHVEATRRIWHALVLEFEKRGIESLEALREWITNAPKAKRGQYQYRLDRLKRLQLPDKPGVYRMLTKTGEVLYVGKATSLRSRVNSYFRGQRGKQKKEMLAQVWDLAVTECATPLEAALLETDEIKRLNPPYNILLKTGRRGLCFYNRDFTDCREEQSESFPIGPFRPGGWIENVRLLHQSLTQGEFEQIFYLLIPPEDLKAGFELFCALNGYSPQDFQTVRGLLAAGMRILKNYEEPEIEDEPEQEVSGEEEAEIEEILTVEDIAGKFERLLRRAATEIQKAKQMTRMLNSDIVLNLPEGDRRLVIRNGAVNARTEPRFRLPWTELGLQDFDRISILSSELKKYEYKIDFLDQSNFSTSKPISFSARAD